jgi:ABC-type bacteriocin/lantibiotic exporter with double-glycine peptidase domain
MRLYGTAVGLITPLRQSAPTDCGLTALEMVLSHHGALDVRPQLRRTLGFAGTGATVYTLIAAARSCGFDAEAFEVAPNQLDQLPKPAILHWRRGHYVVFEGKSGARFTICDPARGRYSMTMKELADQFSGIAIAIEPLNPQPPTGQARSSETPLLSAAIGFRELATAAILLTLTVTALTIGASRAASLVVSALGGRLDPVSATAVIACALLTICSDLGSASIPTG